jgi:hypothetical protein
MLNVAAVLPSRGASQEDLCRSDGRSREFYGFCARWAPRRPPSPAPRSVSPSVVGNGAYQIAPRLANPVFDAKAVAVALKHIGFDVVDGYDLTFPQMRAIIATFSA